MKWADCLALSCSMWLPGGSFGAGLGWVWVVGGWRVEVWKGGGGRGMRLWEEWRDDWEAGLGGLGRAELEGRKEGGRVRLEV